jgi:isopenicillin N synthase-like dioxygenase
MLYYPGVKSPADGGNNNNNDDNNHNTNKEDIRAGAHSDFGSITCLFQLPGQPGLEILTPEGEWAAVAVDPPPASPARPSSGSSSELSAAATAASSPTTATAPRRRNLPILVNIGDLLEGWTGGLLRSTRHRVVFPPVPPPSSHPGEAGSGGGDGGDRYSLAYFCHPLDDAVLEPVPSRLVQERIASSSRTQAATEGSFITAKDHLMRRLAETYTIKT